MFQIIHPDGRIAIVRAKRAQLAVRAIMELTEDSEWSKGKVLDHAETGATQVIFHEPVSSFGRSILKVKPQKKAKPKKAPEETPVNGSADLA